MIELRRAAPSDILNLIKGIREEDAKELQYFTSKTPAELLLPLSKDKDILMPLRDVKAIYSGDTLLGIGGYGRGNVIVGWMILTKDVEDHKMEFLRWSKEYVEDLLKYHDAIVNEIYKYNKWHKRYLEYLGATFSSSLWDKNILCFRIERKKKCVHGRLQDS